MSLESKKATLKLLPALAHGRITKLFENIWFVKGAVKMPMLIPMKISRSMTIVKNPSNGAITLINSMRLSETGLAELEKLGKVTNVIRIAGFHGRDDGFYRARYGAKIYAIKGQAYNRKFEKKKIDPEDGYMLPDVWLNEDSGLPLDSASLKVFHSSDPAEAIIVLNRDGGILVTGDSLQHTAEPDEFVNLPARLMMKKMGFFKPHNVGPGWLQFAHPEKTDIRSVLDLKFEYVLPGHGDPVIGLAKSKFRPVIEGELAGCHS